MIQTYDPDHYSIIHAARQDYKGFYEEEILYREMLMYPPAAHMLAILIASPDKEDGNRLACQIGSLLKEKELPLAGMAGCPAGSGKEGLHVIGPAAASIGKIQDIYRYMVYVKHKDYEELIAVKNIIEAFLEERAESKKAGKEIVQFDFDPVCAY